MWQSHVEIEDYSVAYFDHIAAIYHETSIKGRAHSHFVDSLESYEACMSPTPNRSTAIWYFERSDVIEIHDGLYNIHKTATLFNYLQRL